MKPLTIISAIVDIVLVIGAVFFQLITMFFVLFSSFGIFTCGHDYLILYNSILSGFIFSVVIFAAQLTITLASQNKSTIILKIGFWIITLSTLYPIYLLGRPTLNYTHYYQDFDQEKWLAAREKPLNMIRVFYEDHRFIGKTRKDIIETLGEGVSLYHYENNEIVYETEGFESPLVFYFDNDTVVEYDLSCHD
ncbi:MAG: hypothetical protein H6600_09445 [Flavobacteriales bacterium]|nr:hypothetical protein [Flavobacteriales bacterium]MCB9198673.1 hypothetical protein [Flavobacteriales bacterium]